MPKPTARIPAQTRPDPWRPPPPSEPKMSPQQSKEFFEADRAMHKILDELDELDKRPDGGPQERRDELFKELKVHSEVVKRCMALLSLKLRTAVEEDLTKMNRADRRRMEARLRKQKNARERAQADAEARRR